MGMTVRQIKEQYNVDQVWSWSKYKTYTDDRYMFFLKYVAKLKEDMPNSRYGVAGSDAHAILEDYYNNKIKYEDMINRLEESIVDLNLKNFKYNRTNEEKNNAIGKKYENSLRLFFKQHVTIPHKVVSETFLLAFIGEYLFQGYIDAVHKEDDTFVITDWKTSSIYTGDKLEKEKGQLLIYAIALMSKGISIDKIKLRWNFMKYITVETSLANGNKKERNILRCELGNSLYANAKMWLKKLKYPNDKAESILNEFSMSNDINILPNDLKAKYTFSDCYTYVKLDDEILEEFKIKVVKQLNEANKNMNEYESTKDIQIWWEDITDDYAYFMSNLSGYSKNIHRPYAKYLENLNQNNDKKKIEMEWLEGLFDFKG